MTANIRDLLLSAACSLALLGTVVAPAAAQTSYRDSIGELLSRATGASPAAAQGAGREGPPGEAQPQAKPAPDPREDDKVYQQARDLMQAIDSILKDAAEQRADARKLPGRDEFLVTPMWTETREDRENRIRALLDSALGIVTDAPVVEVQKKVEGLRRNISEIEDQIVHLKERQLTAPKDALLPGMLSDTVASLAGEIKDAESRIEANKAEIAKAKSEIREALRASGIELGDAQIDMLLESVLSGDLVRLVAAFNAAKLIDAQLAERLSASGDNMKAARRYFAMHAALFAMLVHAQQSTIAKIDENYVPKLDAILNDIKVARKKTDRLLKEGGNRPDQIRALEANRKSQEIAEEAARGYRDYLQQQREQLAQARARATHDLRIADNTFETVEASFQLRNLMRDSAASFEAIQKLEAPTFDQIFKNEELRKEFENLTRKLDVPTS
ncbi:MAG: hypothetical protein KJ587_14360 [Alphaproteobacteria bacterium]|nr:hypothetical protein [Alphaproteobacteria bacterium]